MWIYMSFTADNINAPGIETTVGVDNMHGTKIKNNLKKKKKRTCNPVQT